MNDFQNNWFEENFVNEDIRPETNENQQANADQYPDIDDQKIIIIFILR
jgi:hypothetical protein